MELEFIIATFLSIFAIINPMGAVTNYAALTQGFTQKEKKMVVKKAVLVALFILILFSMIGQIIFYSIGITIDAFKVAGGIVLLIIALEMVRGQTPQSKLNEKEKAENLEKAQVGVVPLGVPLLAGPGAITTVMIAASSHGHTISSTLIVILSIMAVLIISYLILRKSDIIFEKLGRTGTKIFTRIWGLLLGAIAIQFIADGLKVLLGI